MITKGQHTIPVWGNRGYTTNIAPIGAFINQSGKIFQGNWLAEVKLLERSIGKLGLLSPILVTESRGRFHVVDGKKRVEALRRINFMGNAPRHLTRVPYIRLCDFNDLESPTAPILSNKALYSSVESAYHGGEKIEDIANRFFLALTTVKEILVLSRLSPRLRAYFFAGELNFQQVKALASQPCPNKQNCMLFLAGPNATAQEVLNAAQIPIDGPLLLERA